MFVHLRMFYCLRTIVFISYGDHSFTRKKSSFKTNYNQKFHKIKKNISYYYLKTSMNTLYNLKREEISNEMEKSKKIS